MRSGLNGLQAEFRSHQYTTKSQQIGKGNTLQTDEEEQIGKLKVFLVLERMRRVKEI